MALVITLVAWADGTEEERVLHTQQIPVWIKAQIDPKTLRRTKRRMPKGSFLKSSKGFKIIVINRFPGPTECQEEETGRVGSRRRA